MATDFSIHIETRNFNRHIRQFLKGVDVETGVALRKFALDLVGRIIKKNPVDKGRARAGWFVAMERLGGSPPTGGDPVAVAKGRSEGGFVDHTKGYKDKWIEIVNGVNYIIFLEYGKSKQAPYGMVRVSMRELSKGQLPRDMERRYRKEWRKFYY